MADIYFYQEDDGDDGDGVYGDSDVITNPDDLLPPIAKLEKYAESDNIFNRQVVARTILETLRVVTDDPDDVNSVLNVMTRLADDVEPSVRAELMEQVPHIAMYGQEYKAKLAHVVPQHLLPMVVKFLTDTNNQVRKTSQAALLVLLEQGLVERSDVQEQVCPVIIRLTEADSLDDYRTEAVALLSKMAPLIGKEMSESIFLERFAALCIDPLFHVRKVCAANFGDFSNVVGSESTEQILLPKFFYLCEDGVWGVRKACADVFMPVSCVCSPSVRQSELSPLFINLLRDQSRWVRMAAFQALGPFISTFADSTITALLHNDNGEIVITDAEQLAQRLDQLEENRAKNNNKSSADAAIANNQETSVSDIKSGSNSDSDYGATSSIEDSPHLQSPGSTGNDILAENNSPELSSEIRDVENKDSSDKLESDGSDSNSQELNTSSSNEESPQTKESFDDMELVSLEDNDNEVSYDIQSGRKHFMSHSQSDIDLSSEERRLELYKNRLTKGSGQQKDSSEEANKGSLTSSESYNDFHYWRQPMATLDIVESNSLKKGVEPSSDGQCPKKDGETGVENKMNSELELDDEIDDQVVLASLTGMNTRKTNEGKQAESNPIDLEELDDLDVIRADDKLNEVEVIELKAADALEGDGIDLVVEPLLSESANETVNVDEDLNTALKEQLQLSKDSSKLINETQGFLEGVNSEKSEDEDELTLNKDTFSNEDSGESEKDQVNQKKDDTNSSSEEGNSNAEQDQEESSMWQKCPVITFQTFDDLTDSNDSSTMELFRPGTVQTSANISTFDPFDTTTTFRGGASADTEKNNVFGSVESSSSNSNNLNPPDPALPKGPPATLQSIVPQLLVDHYVSMIDPSRAQTVDNEIARHCAFSLPAVALTLGRSNWPLLKDTYEALASDMQWKVRRTLASSIHELGIILGEEAAGQDLIPIFNGFLKDLDEVRIGLLKHLADFLKLLKHSDRKEYLPRLSEFLKMDNERNWRFREELADQIGHLVMLFSPDEVKQHLSPIALVLLKDKVSSVRQSSVNVHTNILKYLLHGPQPGSRGNSPIPEFSKEDGASLARVLLAELVEELARVERWTYRQTYALLCHHIFNSSAMGNEQFATEILHNLLDLAWDNVPNVRIVVARALHAIKENEYFTSEDNPYRDRLDEAISTLKNDKDADVRSYFNPPPSLSTCGESTAEYFDSDGEPIGDVSSLPV